MTDEMTIQGQRPSAVPYVLGGAVAGAAAGGATAKFGNFGLQSAKYSSWEDAVKDVNKDDSFVKKQIEKGGDNKANWEEIKNQAEAVKAKEKAVADLNLGDGVNAEDFKALAEKEFAVETAEKELKNAAIDSEIKRIVDGKVEYAIEESKLNGFTKPSDWPAATDGKVKLNADQTKKLFESTAEADKNLVRSLVESHAEVEGLINGEKKGALTDEMVNALNEKRNNITNAKNEVKTAENNLSENAKKVSKDVREKAVNALKDVETAKNTAKEKLTKDLLKKCEHASTWKNAVVGAVVLGLAGLLLRPKAEEDVMEA